MHLQAEADVEAVGDDPLCQLLGVEQAMRAVAPAGCIFAERRREDDGARALLQPMLGRKLAREIVVLAAGENKFHFVIRAQRREIIRPEGAALARTRTLYVHDLVDRARHSLEGALAAGFQQDRVPASEQ